MQGKSTAWHAGLIRQAADNPYRKWLETTGSLTSRLQAASGSFRVERVRQGLLCPLPDEWPECGARRAWVREVLLYCDGRPVVFAHSVLKRRPRHALDTIFRGLGNRALGTLLFTDPRFSRRSMHYLHLNSRHHLSQRLEAVLGQPSPSGLWARRACFEWRGKFLWVTEVFLPAVLELKTKTNK